MLGGFTVDVQRGTPCDADGYNGAGLPVGEWRGTMIEPHEGLERHVHGGEEFGQRLDRLGGVDLGGVDSRRSCRPANGAQ